MHIILVSDRMATARSITLTRLHLALFGMGMLVLMLLLSSGFSYLTVRHAAEIRLPFLQDLLRNISLEETGKTRLIMRESLSTMAARLGEMQGQLMQLDSLGTRLAGLAGVKPGQSASKTSAPLPATATARLGPVAGPSGGPLTRPDNLTPLDMQRALDELSQQIELRSATLAALEDRLFEDRIRQNLLPTARPVAADVRASGYGWRLDPFTGQTAMHEGIDFIAETGTPILAAAAGIVHSTERHPQYGNLVVLDHGNDLMTRYAHADSMLVKPGEFVKRGQKIATVGSTGRSTGPHLHFEVRLNGTAQNPGRFLEKSATALAGR